MPRRYIDTKEYEAILKRQDYPNAVHHYETRPDGFPPIVRVALQGSTWDERLWARSGLSEYAHASKERSKRKYKLTDADMVDLCWIEGPVYKQSPSHEYLSKQVERCAWEKYGGPQGYKSAKKLSKTELSQRTAQARRQLLFVPRTAPVGLITSGRTAARNLTRARNNLAAEPSPETPPAIKKQESSSSLPLLTSAMERADIKNEASPIQIDSARPSASLWTMIIPVQHVPIDLTLDPQEGDNISQNASSMPVINLFKVDPDVIEISD